MQVKPEELLFSKTHEWIHLQRGGEHAIATVGISAFADPAINGPGLHRAARSRPICARGDTIGEIESVKAVSDLVQPSHGHDSRSQYGTRGIARDV